MDREWYGAILEEYKSLRAEAVTARDAQLSILRLSLPLLAALVGVGVSLGADDKLLAGILLSFAVPVIVALTFELWLGQVQRSIRAGSVVAAIEQRLADVFREIDLRPPMGWEQWLRSRPNPSWGKKQGLSQQQQESTVGAGVIFSFLFLAAAGSFGLGLNFLLERPNNTAAYVAITVFAVLIGTLGERGRRAVRGFRIREKVPSSTEVWPSSGTWAGQEAS